MTAPLRTLTVRAIDDVEGLVDAGKLLDEIWGKTNADPLVPLSMLRAISYSGNYVCGAYVEGELAGVLVGFLGRHEGAPQLHSHVLGVSERAWGTGIGFTLKQHQRRWALERGLDLITWTFDPLVRRNAYFNLTKLGATLEAYHPSFYGPMTDGVNAGDETDRVVAAWHLSSPRAEVASGGHAPEPDIDASRRAGAKTVLGPGPNGDPVIEPGSGDVLLAWVPDDIIAMRGRDPELARRWRLAQRNVLRGALADGYRSDQVSRGGWLVLTRRGGPPQP